MTPEQEALFEKLSPDYLLGILIEEEAANQPLAGRVGVGSVVRTRVLTEIDPEKTYWEVILKHVVKNSKEIFQFSFFNEDQPTFPKALELMQDIISGKLDLLTPSLKENRFLALGIVQDQIRDNVGGANHYYAPKICHPSWAETMVITATIADHIFLKGK